MQIVGLNNEKCTALVHQLIQTVIAKRIVFYCQMSSKMPNY